MKEREKERGTMKNAVYTDDRSLPFFKHAF